MSDIGAVTYHDAVAVTESDATNDPAGPFAGFFTGSGGTIKVTTVGDPAGSFEYANAAAGIIIPTQILRVWESTTTATGVGGQISLTQPGAPGPTAEDFAAHREKMSSTLEVRKKGQAEVAARKAAKAAKATP